ncbi:MAG: hypothetical protein K2X27_28060, partial [Candidatus Obscuribacterales bacterium]|nr:hypothetical protein [Candidatus Obscuribacterales bacterium]
QQMLKDGFCTVDPRLLHATLKQIETKENEREKRSEHSQGGNPTCNLGSDSRNELNQDPWKVPERKRQLSSSSIAWSSLQFEEEEKIMLDNFLRRK